MVQRSLGATTKVSIPCMHSLSSERAVPRPGGGRLCGKARRNDADCSVRECRLTWIIM